MAGLLRVCLRLRHLNCKKGSVTVEAAIVLPIVICCILTIGLFTKIYYTHQLLQYAITNVAHELSSISYGYYRSGLYDIQLEFEDGLNRKATQAEERMNSLQESYYSLLDAALAIQESPETAIENIGEIKESVDHLFEIGQGIYENPVDEIKSLIALFGKGLYQEGKTYFGNVIVGELVKKHLVTSKYKEVDHRLKQLNIVDGWKGLDFSQSVFMDENNDIDIILIYEIELPIPIKVIKSIPIIQRVTIQPWIKGRLPITNLNSGLKTNLPEDLIDEVVEAGFDVWQLPTLQRGREIKRILNRNLDEAFPIIDSKVDNKVIAIRTHDTRLKSNAGRSFYYQLTSDIRTLDGFTEATFKGISVGMQDYSEKVLNILLPDVEVSEEQIQALRDAKEYAQQRRIIIKITIVK